MEKIEKYIKDIWLKYKFIIISSILIGLICHGFVLTNKLVNHDEVYDLFTKGTTFEVGRWGLEITKFIFPNISMPWLYGIISILLITISSCLIINMLDIKSKIYSFLVSSIMMTFPSITCLFSYMFTSCSYSLSILLAVLSVYLAISKNKIYNLISIILLILSLSIYQAYIGVVLGLLVTISIKKCLNKEDIKTIILDGLKYIIIVLISLISYLILTKIINNIVGVNLSDYQNASKGISLNFIDIIKGIYHCYYSIHYILFYNYYGIAPGNIISICYAINFVIIIILTITTIKKLNIKNSILLIILILLLPLSINIIYLITPNIEFHTLMFYSNFIYFIIPILFNNKKINYILIALLIVLNYTYITYANESYLKLHLTYENTYSYYTNLVNRIETTEGFNQDSKIAIIGETKDNNLFYDNSKQFNNLENYGGIVSNKELINSYSIPSFIKYYIGIDFNYATEEEIQNIINNEEYKNMSIYPYDNSINKIDNYIVVKLSEAK